MGVPATAIPARASTPAPTESSISPRTFGRQIFELAGGGRVAGDVALAVADDARLQRVMEGDLAAAADDQLGRAAADVDHQCRLGWRRLGGGTEVGQPRLLLAVEDPGREREPLPQLGDEGAAVVGVADRTGRDRVDRLGAELLEDPDVTPDRGTDVLDRLAR